MAVGMDDKNIHHGQAVKPFLITSIQDSEGNSLAEFEGGNVLPPAFSEENRLIMLEMLKSVVDRGTASRIRHKISSEERYRW